MKMHQVSTHAKHLSIYVVVEKLSRFVTTRVICFFFSKSTNLSLLNQFYFNMGESSDMRLFDQMKSAASEEGVSIEDLVLTVGSGNRGLTTLCERKEGEVLLSMPWNLVISSRSEDCPEVLRPLFDHIKKRPELRSIPGGYFLEILFRVLYELKHPSNDVIKHYLKFLHVNVQDFAHRWSAEAVRLCGPMSLLPMRVEDSKARIKKLQSVVEDLVLQFKEIFPKDSFDDDFIEMVHCFIMSRCHNTKFNEEKLSVLIPFADFCNHKPSPFPAANRFVTYEKEYLVIKATGDIQAGDEVTFSYGDFGNDILACNYGFTISNNPHDQVPLGFSKSVIDEYQFELLKQLNIADFLRRTENGGYIINLVFRGCDPFPAAGIMAARILMNDSEKLKEWWENDKHEFVKVQKIR